MDQEGNENLRYVLRLLIKHPSLDPEVITRTLGLTPRRSWAAGTPRKTPTGTPLEGVYRESMWGYSTRVEGNRLFSADIEKMVATLKPQAAFLNEIVQGKGSISIIVHLAGDTNIGDDMSWRLLEQISALKINFGIEVFPEFN